MYDMVGTHVLVQILCGRWLLLVGLIMELLGYTWFEVMVAGATAGAQVLKSIFKVTTVSLHCFQTHRGYMPGF